MTGVSTGALTAPFAFLGPHYDETLEEIYTSYSTDDLITKRNLFRAISSDAFAGTDKLAELIAKYIDEQVFEAIAEEYRRGRVLNIGTTNLDAMRPVIWNIGRIAASGEPGALRLVRRIILASVSIPAAFPPVPIGVEAGGRRYEELHVDGGASSQVFLYPSTIEWSRVLEKLELPGRPHVYVIRNSRLDPEAIAVERKLLPITGRSIDSLIRTQGIGDLYRIYTLAERDGLDFHLAYIAADFTDRPAELFDPVWMRRLFDHAYAIAKAGYPWKDAPPDLAE